VRRREFITLIGGAAAARSLLGPLAARAQQPERLRRIGILMNRAADNPEGQDRLAAFHQGLQELGLNVEMYASRFAGARTTRTRA